LIRRYSRVNKRKFKRQQEEIDGKLKSQNCLKVQGEVAEYLYIACKVDMHGSALDA